MININEIRIGNMITHYPTGKLVPVDYDHVKSLIRNPEEYNPIPLKAELLTITGFEEIEKNKWNTKLLPFQLIADETDGFSYVLSDNEVRHVTSLHQLQNLYFALTNEELHVQLTL
ncbi:MAG: hypothetical protein JWQ40_1079 [Segetibacter sp.]|nr:hypothetical protein [Segetibacter sp.]